MGRPATLLAAVAALTVAPACRPALVAPADGGPAWTMVESPHFVIRTDLSQDEAVRQSTRFEMAHRALSDLAFTATRGPTGRVSVVLFRDREAFHAMGYAYNDGFFRDSDTDRHPTIAMTAEDPDHLMPGIQHELTHRFVAHYMPTAPRWLNEGLALLYEGLVVEDGLATFRIERMIGAREVAPVSEILSFPASAFADPTLQRRAYGSSLALTHMLRMGTPDLQKRFDAFLGDLTGAVTGSEAWDAHFEGIALADLDEALFAHMQVGRWAVGQIAYTAPASPAGRARTMTDGEVRTLWASLMLFDPKKVELTSASAHLERALSAEPDLAEGHFWKSVVLERQEDRKGQERELRRALDLAPNEGRYWFALAGLLLQGAQDPSRPAGALLLPAQGTPADDALEHLAYTATTARQLTLVAGYLASHGKVNPALSFARRAVEEDPSCWGCIDLMAQIVFKQGDPATAAKIEGRALSLAPEEAVEDLRTRKRHYEKIGSQPPEAP